MPLVAHVRRRFQVMQQNQHQMQARWLQQQGHPTHIGNSPPSYANAVRHPHHQNPGSVGDMRVGAQSSHGYGSAPTHLH